MRQRLVRLDRSCRRQRPRNGRMLLLLLLLLLLMLRLLLVGSDCHLDRHRDLRLVLQRRNPIRRRWAPRLLKWKLLPRAAAVAAERKGRLRSGKVLSGEKCRRSRGKF